MRVLTVVGARPQFIKAAPVSNTLRRAGHTEYLVHTGQHYDKTMSQVFFEELDIPEPDVNLGIGSGSHGLQTGRMLIALEEVMIHQKPDWVLVYGDTNSTLAGALAAVKLQLPVAHVEAGLRSYNRAMPEEHNRVLTDHCSTLLFCPTESAVRNLASEGIRDGVYLTGDTMYDAVLQFAKTARQRSTILEEMGLSQENYVLATIHRPYNVDDRESLGRILVALQDIGELVVFPVHPRTRQRIEEFKLVDKDVRPNRVRLIEPVGYLDMLMLEKHARLILTDSGGVQKEAYFFGVPCITLRPETEWVETVELGWNTLVGADPEKIREAVKRRTPRSQVRPPIYGEGQAAQEIVQLMGAQPI